MHPALSVIFFTTVSGAGLGLLGWLGVWLALGVRFDGGEIIVAAIVGLALLTAGLISSTLHLGKPLRSWRAFSQWRSSWLSREGVTALLTFVPALWIVFFTWRGDSGLGLRIAGAALLAMAIVTTLCTSRIYDTIKAIPAWYQPLVLPNYFVIGALTGAAWFGVLTSGPATVVGSAIALFALAGVAFKWTYWRVIDEAPMPTSLGSLTGLERFGDVRSFEAPHTETNYLLREMGFVLARKHAKKLRAIAVMLLYVVPLFAGLMVLVGAGRGAALVALVAATTGAFVERWLFFAEAKHVVTLYYPAPRQSAM